MIFTPTTMQEKPRGYEFMDQNKSTRLSFRKLLVVDGEQSSYKICRTIEDMNDARIAFNTVFQLSQMPEEIFAAMFLDIRFQINGMAIISHGSLNASVVTMRELFKYALAYNAQGLIVAHNHPSGVAFPSQDDKSITEKIKSSAEIMDIFFFDHIIIAAEQCYSLTQDMLLKTGRSFQKKMRG